MNNNCTIGLFYAIGASLKNDHLILFFSTPEICAKMNSYGLVMTDKYIKLGQTRNHNNVVSLYNCEWEEEDT